MHLPTPRRALRTAPLALASSALLAAAAALPAAALPAPTPPSAPGTAPSLDAARTGAAERPAASTSGATPYVIVFDAATLLGRGTEREPLTEADIASGDVALHDPVSFTETPALAAAVRAKAAEYRAAGITVTAELTAVGGLTVEMTQAQSEDVRLDPSVAWIEEDTVVSREPRSPASSSAPRVEVASWGLDRIDQRALPLDGAYLPNGTGAGVTVYVVDSGIDPDHVAFAGRLDPGIDLVGDGAGTRDCSGHGTHTAGTAVGAEVGVAPGARVVPVRVLGCDDLATYAGIAEGLDWVAQNAAGPAVVNISINSPGSLSFDRAVQRVLDRGITVTASAGNSAADSCLESPGRVPGVLTVGASTHEDRRAAQSDVGPCIDLFAPGTHIVSAAVGTGDGHTALSGTSMAAPHVAGAAALRLERDPRATPAQVADAILTDATPGVLTNITPDTPDLLLHTPRPSAGITPSAPAQPAALLRQSSWSIRAQGVSGEWGQAERGDVFVVGDWDGDGTDGVGLRRGSEFRLWNGAPAGPPDLAFDYGTPGEAVVVGDWDGDGTDGVGVRRGGDFLLRDVLSAGPATRTVTFGRPGDRPIAGDFDGDGVDTPGVVRENRVLLRDDLAGGAATRNFWYGLPGEPILVGDFNGDGIDTLAVRRGNTFHLRNSLTSGDADVTRIIGTSRDVALLGDWDGDGVSTPAHVRH